MSAASGLAAALAARGRAVQPGMCLRTVRGFYGLPGGVPDASAAWRAAINPRGPVATPPPGAPVFWTGGAHGHGHIAVMSSGGYIVSTDAPARGRIGTVPLGYPSQRWGLRYEGWAEGWAGHRIDGLSAPVVVPLPGGAHLPDLHYGARNETVKRLQVALNVREGAGLPVTGYYGDLTDRAVRACQRRHGYGADREKHSNIGPRQAAHLGLG